MVGRCVPDSSAAARGCATSGFTGWPWMLPPRSPVPRDAPRYLRPRSPSSCDSGCYPRLVPWWWVVCRGRASLSPESKPPHWIGDAAGQSPDRRQPVSPSGRRHRTPAPFAIARACSALRRSHGRPLLGCDAKVRQRRPALSYARILRHVLFDKRRVIIWRPLH